VGAGECCNAASTNAVGDDSGVYGGLTDEAVATVDMDGICVVGIGSANDEALVYDRLVANYMGFQKLGCSAVGWTAES
jgi:hypothetical protein